MKKLIRDPRFVISGLVIVIIVGLAVFAPLLTRDGAVDKMNPNNRLEGPSEQFILGTDEFGRDIWSRLLFGAQLSFRISLGAVTIALVIGTLLGLNAGYFGGAIELIIMRVVDFLMSFPGILVAMFVIVFIGSSIGNLILTVGIVYIAHFARISYSSTLSIKNMEFIEASRASGSKNHIILFSVILPNIVAPLLVQVSMSLGNAMLLESSLSFLGLGPPPYIPSWGRSISEATRYMSMSPWGLIWPSIVLSLSVLAFNIMGDAIRDAVDPRLRNR